MCMADADDWLELVALRRVSVVFSGARPLNARETKMMGTGFSLSLGERERVRAGVSLH